MVSISIGVLSSSSSVISEKWPVQDSDSYIIFGITLVGQSVNYYVVIDGSFVLCSFFPGSFPKSILSHKNKRYILFSADAGSTYSNYR
jgi:hypothetical protein